MADKKSDGGKNFLAFLTGGIKEYGNVMAERTKLQSQMMSNRLTANQNWLYKLQQQQAERKMQNQRVKDAYQGGAGEAGYGMGYTPEGGRTLTTSSKSAIQLGIYNAIKRKDEKSWDKRDRAFIDQYEGRTKKEKEPTAGDKNIIGYIRKLKGGGASIAEIRQMIEFEGEDPTKPIFLEEFRGYFPEE